MIDPWFLYVLGILMAIAGWLGGRNVKETEELERLMNSGLEEWEIVKLRIATQKSEPHRKLTQDESLPETESLKELLLTLFRMPRR